MLIYGATRSPQKMLLGHAPLVVLVPVQSTIVYPIGQQMPASSRGTTIIVKMVIVHCFAPLVNGYATRYLQRTTNVAAYSALQLQFSVTTWKMTNQRQCQVRYGYNGVNFQMLWEGNGGSGTNHNNKVENLDSIGSATTVTIRLQIYGNSNDCDNACYFDNVILKGIPRTDDPTPTPTDNPTRSPTDYPTPAPTTNPTPKPTSPTTLPTNIPTGFPTKSPTKSPTNIPTKSPTNFPTTSPTQIPSSTTTLPTNIPTRSPIKSPTQSPSDPSKTPTNNPTTTPTNNPSETPTKAPTNIPTITPTKQPTNIPTQYTNTPTAAPNKLCQYTFFQSSQISM